MNFFNFSMLLKNVEAITVKLLVQLPGKLLSMIWILVTKTSKIRNVTFMFKKKKLQKRKNNFRILYLLIPLFRYVDKRSLEKWFHKKFRLIRLKNKVSLKIKFESDKDCHLRVNGWRIKRPHSFFCVKYPAERDLKSKRVQGAKPPYVDPPPSPNRLV